MRCPACNNQSAPAPLQRKLDAPCFGSVYSVELQQETLQRSGRQEYMTADTSFNQTGAVKVQEQAFRVATEQSRQRDEKTNLEKAFKIEKAQLVAEWAKKIEEVCRCG